MFEFAENSNSKYCVASLNITECVGGGRSYWLLGTRTYLVTNRRYRYIHEFRGLYVGIRLNYNIIIIIIYFLSVIIEFKLDNSF